MWTQHVKKVVFNVQTKELPSLDYLKPPMGLAQRELRAVGAFDIPNRPRWRRPETKELPTPQSFLASWLKPSMGLAPRELPAEHCTVGAASTV